MASTLWRPNVAASGVGYVTRFKVAEELLDRDEVQQAGGQTILEYWIPAEDLDDFNAHTWSGQSRWSRSTGSPLASGLGMTARIAACPDGGAHTLC